MPEPDASQFLWLRTGKDTFETIRSAIDEATESVRFEIYIYQSGSPGDELRDALIRAARRGLEVRMLLDAFGCITLSDRYWDPLREAGGDLRWFNPISLKRFSVRNHRKLVVCDRQIAFVGGFNVAPVWLGDGITNGWRDLGLRVTSPLADDLAASFDLMFALADFRHKAFPRIRKARARQSIRRSAGELLLSGPGRGQSPIRRAWTRDLAHARSARIIAACFLPPPGLRRAISRVARRGGRVQLVLAGKSDIWFMPAATRGLYQRLMRAGVEIYEYEPQILHTKFLLIDSAVYVGSANLDIRSLSINYDFQLRLTDPNLISQAHQVFLEHLAHSRPIDKLQWRHSRNAWCKLKERIASFLFTRIDPFVTRRQLRNMR